MLGNGGNAPPARPAVIVLIIIATCDSLSATTEMALPWVI